MIAPGTVDSAVTLFPDQSDQLSADIDRAVSHVENRAEGIGDEAAALVLAEPRLQWLLEFKRKAESVAAPRTQQIRALLNSDDLTASGRDRLVQPLINERNAEVDRVLADFLKTEEDIRLSFRRKQSSALPAALSPADAARMTVAIAQFQASGPPVQMELLADALVRDDVIWLKTMEPVVRSMMARDDFNGWVSKQEIAHGVKRLRRAVGLSLIMVADLALQDMEELLDQLESEAVYVASGIKTYGSWYLVPAANFRNTKGEPTTARHLLPLEREGEKAPEPLAVPRQVRAKADGHPQE